jgi:carbon monoxide dehydrogenase subunit G
MEFEAEHRFDGSRDLVWDSLHDPDVLARALPGNASIELTEAGEYVGEMRAGVGPVTAARFDVKVTLSDEVPREAFTMNVDGRGAAGFVEGPVRVTLEDEGSDGTLMRYAADLQIGGRIAGVGQRLLDSVGKGMARKSLEEVNQHICGGDDVGADVATAGAAADSLAGVHAEVSRAARTVSRPLVISVAAILLIIILVILL